MPIVIDERNRRRRAGLGGLKNSLGVIPLSIDENDFIFIIHLECPGRDDDTARGTDTEVSIDFDTHIMCTVRRAITLGQMPARCLSDRETPGSTYEKKNTPILSRYSFSITQ